MPNGPQPHNPPQNSGGDDITKIGALSDGFANTATNSTEIDDGSNGYIGTANGDNRNNYNDSGTHDANNDNSQTTDSNNSTDSSSHTDVDVDAQIDVAVGNGNDRDNTYDWDYNDQDTTTTSATSSVSDSYNDVDTTSTSTSTSVADSNNYNYEDYSNRSDNSDHSDNSDRSDNSDHSDNSVYSDSSDHSTDNHFADLDNLTNTGNLGLAGGDLTFNLGDDFSFTLDVKDILNNSLNGDGNDVGFSLVQANHLADQDYASGITMENGGATNTLTADGGEAYGAAGIEAAGDCWTPAANISVGDDMTGSSTANASAIVANSGFHLELVQGANLLSNTLDSTIAGGDVHHSGEDSTGA